MISPGVFIPQADNPFAMRPQPDPYKLLIENASPEFLACLQAGVEMKSELRGNVFTVTTVPKCAVVDMGDGTKRVFVRYDESASCKTPARASTSLV